MADILTTALQFAAQKISTVPVATDGSKRPAVSSWKEYQNRLPEANELLTWFSTAEGVGVICGAVSGNLEMLELEGRAVAEKMHIEAEQIAVNSGLKDVWDKVTSGYCESTPAGGLHWLYRIDEAVPGNTKLARRPGLNGGVDVLAETRGEGGFVIVAPSNGTCHPSGGSWQMLSGSPATIATITMAERDSLHSLFAIFDAMPKSEVLAEEIKPKSQNSGLLPGDDYNQRVTWEQILTPLGWTKIYSKNDAIAWCRPGKTEGISATTNFNGSDKLYVFSTSTIFDAEHSYSKFAAYARIEHSGDFSKAARALRLLGYGTASNDLSVLPSHSPSLVQLRDANEDVTTSSWIPDLITETDISEEPAPCILKRADGNSLFYAGKINALIGESESGKTWVALEAVRQELEKNNPVFYLDFEDSKRGMFNRLKTMQTPSEDFRGFHYANPDSPLSEGEKEALMTKIDLIQPTLIVVDGVNAAMNLFGWDLEKNKDATAFNQWVLRPLRLNGAAVITIDHVTKSKDNRGNYAIGAQSKRADIDGCAIGVSVDAPFGRGIDGRLMLTVLKDRPGFVRAIAIEGKDVGVVHLRSSNNVLSVTVEGASVQVSTAEMRMEQVSNYLEKSGGELSFNELRRQMRDRGMGMGAENMKGVLAHLEIKGFVTSRMDGQKVLFSHRKAFLTADVEPLPVDNSGENLW